jgi:3-hydroxymyristoyl/3-hydroxydecanoyl-(acyl carrier protein) dehydratase
MKNIDIQQLIPQRLPYIMVDELIHYDPVIAKSIFTIREDNIFCVNGRLEESGLIENIAQTCAARTGYKTLFEECEDIKIGYLGMIREMKIRRNPRLGEMLLTTTEIKAEIFSTTLVEAKIEVENEIIAECEMKIFLTDKTISNF